MNPNDSAFEEELRALRPRPVSTALEQKIAAGLARQEIVVRERPAGAILRDARPSRAPRPGWLNGLGWAFAGAAAAVAVIAAVERSEVGGAGIAKSTPAATSTELAAAFEHPESTEQLVTAEDEGVIMASNQEPLRQLHFYSLERHVWTDPRTGTRVEFELPREDVRFTPVALQ